MTPAQTAAAAVASDEALIEKMAMAMYEGKTYGDILAPCWEDFRQKDKDVWIGSAQSALSVLRSEGRLVEQGEVAVPMEPTEEMLNAARDWSYHKYGKPVGNDGTSGCYRAMLASSPRKPVSKGSEG